MGNSKTCSLNLLLTLSNGNTHLHRTEDVCVLMWNVNSSCSEWRPRANLSTRTQYQQQHHQNQANVIKNWKYSLLKILNIITGPNRCKLSEMKPQIQLVSENFTVTSDWLHLYICLQIQDAQKRCQLVMSILLVIQDSTPVYYNNLVLVYLQ